MSKEKMIAVAKRGLALEENFKLDMSEFCSVYYKNAKPECGTAFCFAGILAYQDGHPDDYVGECIGGCTGGCIGERVWLFDGFNYVDYSSDLIGYRDPSEEWSFLFGEDWPNSFEHLKARCQYIVDHNGSVPHYDDDGGFEGFPYE